MNRRQFAAAAVGTATGGALIKLHAPAHLFAGDQRPRRSRVAILPAEGYSGKLDELLYDGLRLFALDVKGKTVLLKPNLVEYIAGVEVNTNPWLVGAAAEAFLRLGARGVLVGEGPGHQRDTQLVLAESGFDTHLSDRKIGFVDLNRDEVVGIGARSGYTAMKSLWLPRAVLDADFVVSMPKVKTHHWAGVTLSLKNMFGLIPGAVYGWPKNVLHWQGIERSILDICSTIRPHFAIADGIVAMEGNGPLHGTHRKLHTIVLADDPVAADFTCARLMGLIPERIYHLAQAARFLGNGSPDKIDLLAGAAPHGVQPFAVLPQFRHLQAAKG
ncbi:MAG: DUF362 domain-containing protein [Phycisphaerales bacterium]|nr:DUF362 domain-containing protein [Phycisphaerales bacterium]